MSNLLNRIKDYVSKHFIAETFTSLIAIVWGLSLLHPDATFTLPSYKPMLDIAPEYAWGLLALGIGIFQYIGMVGRKFYLRTISALLATGFWIFVGVMFCLTPIMNTAGGTYIIIGIMTGVLYVKVGGQR
ncbi:putative membrane protein [Bacillus phage SP-15]|uniref:Putative membrane protein n=1 Tax=Bacillus phage SP-15 TaxID=1792032 RepID=A0A127AW56_9CAUD|nr:hypothetical protein SP15_066 [Bacillus phage SP-15]AMM44865.1 putative membrane protein [Bacillus phage SP-15]